MINVPDRWHLTSAGLGVETEEVISLDLAIRADLEALSANGSKTIEIALIERRHASSCVDLNVFNKVRRAAAYLL